MLLLGLELNLQHAKNKVDRLSVAWKINNMFRCQSTLPTPIMLY